mmetsp:Transcript_24678/g.44311  ORF Transcript_24678/g.44311 Transcript_24678/m.44311 type:complete len:217 (+) Transcript_24678:218-868(+)
MCFVELATPMSGSIRGILHRSRLSFPRESDTSLFPNRSLLCLIRCNHILIDISQNKLHSLRKIRHISHLKLGPIPQEKHHVSIPKQPLDRSDLHDIGVHNLCHILSSDTGCYSDTTIGNLVPDPGLACPCRGGGDDSDDCDDGEGGGKGFGDGGWTLVEGFFGSEGGGGFGGSCGGGVTALSFSSLGLGSPPTHLLHGIKRLISLFSIDISHKCGL